MLDVAGVGLGHPLPCGATSRAPRGPRLGPHRGDLPGARRGRVHPDAPGRRRGAQRRRRVHRLHHRRRVGVGRDPGLPRLLDLQLGRVYDFRCRIDLEVNPACATDFIIPWSASAHDVDLNDARRMQVEHEDVVAAYDAAI